MLQSSGMECQGVCSKFLSDLTMPVYQRKERQKRVKCGEMLAVGKSNRSL